MRMAHVRPTVVAGILLFASTLSSSAQQPVAPTERSPDETAQSQPLGSQDEMTSAVGVAVEAALTSGGFGSLVEQFSAEDRERVGSLPLGRLAALNAIADGIRDLWEVKYGSEAAIADASTLAGFLGTRADSGETPRSTDAPLLREEEPEHVGTTGTTIDPSLPPSMRVDDTTATDGRERAIVVLAGDEGAHRLTISLVRETLPPEAAARDEPWSAWKLDVPDHVDSERLVANLEQQLTMLKEDAARWPADATEATRMLARHVLAAVYDMPAERRN